MVDALFDEGIDPNEKAEPRDVNLIKVALRLVGGFVETSRGEGSDSVSTKWEAVKANIIRVCGEYGLDASDYIEVSSISDASHLW
jgi:hypothetical protein